MIHMDPSTNPPIVNPNINIVGTQYESNPDAAYGDHIKNTAAICNTSASHTYGNVMSVVEKYICDLFKNSSVNFRTVIASTTLASRQVTHLPNQLQKKELPMMVLVPRIVFGQDDGRFLGHTLINDRYTNTHALWGDGSLIPLGYDRKNNLWIHGHYNRALMYVDIVLCFDTYIEQLNCMAHINNMMAVNHNQFIRAPLELFIPIEFCELIGKMINIPIRSESGSVYNFLTHMNSIWYHPITYKLKGGSNTDDFFMYYITDIDSVIQDVQAGQGIKDGQVKRNFEVTFTIRCEFNTIGYFTLNSPSLKKQMYVPTHSDQSILPIFSDSINLDDFKLPVGWSILSWPIFKLKPGENSVSLKPILNQSLNAVIDYHLQFGIPMNRFISIQFRENGNILPDEIYYIDWKQRELIISRPNVRRTYRLIISVSHDYINNLIKELYNLE